MVNQNKMFTFKIKRQAKNVFPNDAERTVAQLRPVESSVVFICSFVWRCIVLESICFSLQLVLVLYFPTMQIIFSSPL